MKTLKQQLKEELFNLLAWKLDDVQLEVLLRTILETNTEWLTQKRQYYHSYPFESDNPNAVVCSVFKELLEELKK